MNRLLSLLELAGKGKQFKTSLTETSPRAHSPARGAILGARSSNQRSFNQVEDFHREDESVLNALIELSAGDSPAPVNRLCEKVFNGDTRKLERVLPRMQVSGVIALEKGANGELGVKLTVKGAVVALYGDWLLGECHNNTNLSSPQIPATKSSA